MHVFLCDFCSGYPRQQCYFDGDARVRSVRVGDLGIRRRVQSLIPAEVLIPHFDYLTVVLCR
ncbi:hypothetical protein A0H81_04009, partial [Grifola frondosa]